MYYGIGMAGGTERPRTSAGRFRLLELLTVPIAYRVEGTRAKKVAEGEAEGGRRRGEEEEKVTEEHNKTHVFLFSYVVVFYLLFVLKHMFMIFPYAGNWGLKSITISSDHGRTRDQDQQWGSRTTNPTRH